MNDVPVRVLFVCPDNASRSQMAEGWLRQLAGERCIARSAGVEPTHLHPLATRAMQEIGVDIAPQRGKGLAAVRRERFDVVVTLCDSLPGEIEDLSGNPRQRHCPIDDPAWLETDDGADLDEFRRVRDALRDVVAAVIADELNPTFSRESRA